MEEGKYLDEPVGVKPPPPEVDAQVQAMLRRIRILSVIATCLVLLAVGIYLGTAYVRGQDNSRILQTLKVNGSPEAIASQQAYLELFRYQLDCDGRIREEESDNELLRIVAAASTSQVSFPPVDISSESKSCKAVPSAEKKLADASAKLRELRESIED